MGFLAVSLTPAIGVALHGLLNTLTDPVATDLFIPTQIHQVVFAALQQPQVQAFIHGWVAHDGRYAHFLTATDFIVRTLAQPITLDEIAKKAGMSVPTLHRVFKQYTADSPMQYVKKLRLNQAHVQLSQTAVQCKPPLMTRGTKAPRNLAVITNATLAKTPSRPKGLADLARGRFR